MEIPLESRATFIVCTFSMLGKLSGIDGEISEAEMRRVEKYIDEELKLDDKTRALALETFETASRSPLDLRDYAEKFASAFPDRVQRLNQLVEILVAVSVADGVLSPEEDRAIRSTALLLGISEPAFERIKSKYIGRRMVN